MTGRLQRGALLAGMLAGAALCGCQDPSGNWARGWGGAAERSDRAPVKSNIVQVVKYFHANPWLSFSVDGSGLVDGVRFALYLVCPTTEGNVVKYKGAFGDGAIVVEMYRLEHDPRTRENAVLVHKWELPPEKARVWRAKKETMLGWGYGLRLQWEEGLDVEGKQV
ncbi:MAG: hypothetical protein V3S01_08705, partial [Dehalococcoidia bacterium]